MNSQAEIETSICSAMTSFAEEYLGKRPGRVRAYLLNGLLVVRLGDVLNAAEVRLLSMAENNKGRDLLKQLRTQLIETSRPVLTEMVEEITGLKMLSLHHDISTVTREEVIIFTLVAPPPLQKLRK